MHIFVLKLPGPEGQKWCFSFISVLHLHILRYFNEIKYLVYTLEIMAIF